MISSFTFLLDILECNWEAWVNNPIRLQLLEYCLKHSFRINALYNDI